ncbi:phenylacetyl-CoA ligase [Mycena albidolilacea]|uniref:Phenylacetyl-CoA ligase n=1 Tax=Mycena albidolilacea TaxID=1033008 RepID=A0AAD7ARK1_9AGAR|nr:phenylacetyl-CoA ligase [Mycena albidolilacea]
MSEIHATSGVLPSIPDDLSVPQFQLDYNDPNRPTRPANIPALIEDATGRRVFLPELRERTQGLANALSSLYSLREDDVVLLFSRNHVDYPVAIWAVHRLGGIISPANPDFGPKELEYQLKATKAALIITHPDALETSASAAQSIGMSPERILVFDVPGASTAKLVTVNDLVKRGSQLEAFTERKLRPGEGKTKLAFLSFSSGTTGTPKAVAIPHIALIANVLQMASHAKVNEDYAPWKDRRYRPGDVALGVLPLYHIYGLVVNLHFLLYNAMTVVVIPKFNFENMLKSIVRHRITHLMIVPPQAVLLCKHPAVKKYDLSGIRYIMIGAAPLSDEVNQKLFSLFPEAHIGQGYGMTETCTVTSIWSIERKRGFSGGAGQLVPGVIARIVKTDGTLGGYNDIGELVVKAPSNALGYYNNAQATKETFVDGWVRTGDEVKITPDGELWIIDRIKEILKVKGFQVAPAELEGTLLDHPDVSDTCVVGIPDEFSGEVPLAFVVLTVDAAARVKTNPRILEETRASILKHVADNKVAYKHLAGGVEFVDSIPKTPSGKLLRRVLREKAKELRKAPKAKL